MSLENQSVFLLPEEVNFRLLYHSSTSSVSGSFACHSSAFSGLLQASQGAWQSLYYTILSNRESEE
jgi:hypothetical protein